MDKDKVLLLYGGWMGDFIWMMPVIRAMSSHFGARNLSLLVSEQQGEMAGLLEGKLVDKVHVDVKDERPWNQLRFQKQFKRSGIGTYIDMSGKVATEFSIPYSLKDMLGKVATWFSIPYTSSTDIYKPSKIDAKDKLAQSLHPRAKRMPTRKHTHRVDSYLEALDFFGIKDYKINFDLVYSQETKDKMEKFIAKNQIRERESIVLNLGAAQYSKIWPANRFLMLALELQKQDYQVVIMGADHFKWNNHYDRAAAEQWFENKYKGIILVKGTTLEENTYLLRHGGFRLSVGCDSFPNHMAGSANEVDATEDAVLIEEGRYARRSFKAPTRTLTLMGPTNPDHCHVWDPTNSFHGIIRNGKFPLMSRGCGMELCDYNGFNDTCSNYGKVPVAGISPCMLTLEIGQVLHKINQMIMDY
jgi:ADP-heptose:LPS heptosyltransferase